MQRRARARRPAESLDELLPRFDADGTLEDTPDPLRAASRVEELLNRRVLAEKAQVASEGLPALDVASSRPFGFGRDFRPFASSGRQRQRNDTQNDTQRVRRPRSSQDGIARVSVETSVANGACTCRLARGSR